MKKIAFFFLALLSLTSCKKVIDYDLNTTDPKVIIEAEITDQTDGFSVKIAKTVNFSQANNYPAVLGATVTVSDNKGESYTLLETKDGLYTLKGAKGVSGKTYTLKVVAEGKTYTASSTMPKALDLLRVEVNENNFPGAGGGPGSKDTSYVYLPVFFDPADVANNYVFFLYVNGKKDKGFDNVFNDNIINGVRNQRPIIGSSDFKVTAKDVVTVEMMCVDKGVYDYFYSLSQITSSNNNSATPTNPVSNIKGGALGYFSAHTVRKANAIVP
jgi:hypothetical protein